MSRHFFGGSPSDYAMEKVGNQLLLRPAAVGTVWDASTGGTQLTDLTDPTGTPATEVTADSDGAVSFFGPDGVTSLYVDFGYGRRYALAAIDTGAVLAAFMAQGGAPDGWAQLDGSGHLDPSQFPAQLDWHIVSTYGAVGDGAADDTIAIQTAINACPAGGVVYFPRGVYKTTATLDLGNGVTLLGAHANLMIGPGMTGAEYPCYIQPAIPFTGTSVIQIIGDADGTHPDISGEQRITNLMVDGSQLTGTSIDGLYAKGNVQNVVLDNVTIRQMPNNGIVTAARTSDGKYPYSWRLHSVMVDNCHANGILFTNNTDITLDDVQVIGCWAQGFVLANCSNGQLIACRAEWNGSHGFHITGAWGNWAGSGGMLMTGCSTDRNGQNGVLIDATGATPIQIDNLHMRRDGRNGGTGGGGYAGLNVAAATVPVIVAMVTCYPGVDDNGTQTNSPQYGARFTGNTYVAVASGFLHAATAGWSDGGGNAVLRRGPNIGERTGTTTAPTNVFTQPWTAAGALTADSFNTDGTIRSANFRTQSDTEHALTVYQRATGTSPGSVALNVISDKPGDSAMWVTGHETARGTLKVAHLNGSANATSDAGAAALSIDLQYNGKGGTAAQGIFLTATEGATTGNLITLRNAASPTREDFVVKADGKVGIRIPVGNTPLGILQVGMVDDTNVGLFIKANSGSGQQSILIQDSAGANRFEVSAGGSAIHRASSYFTSSIQIGATSLAIGGLNGTGIGITNSTAAPTSSPAGGGVLYALAGALMWKGSSGTNTTIAPA